MYIIFLDDSKGPGAHWVAIISDFEDEAIYFDLFELPPPEELINIHNYWYYIDSQHQCPGSLFCRYYCLHFLKKIKY